MKDLDKIKELVATCDSTNIELAIALGVNMEGYKRWTLHTVIYNELYKYIKEWLLFKCYHDLDDMDVYRTKLKFIEGNKESEKFKTPASTETDRFVAACIGSYLSL